MDGIPYRCSGRKKRRETLKVPPQPYRTYNKLDKGLAEREESGDRQQRQQISHDNKTSWYNYGRPNLTLPSHYN